MVKRKRARSVKSVLKEQILLVKPEEDLVAHLKTLTKKFKESLRKEMRRTKINPDVFIGGSFAKGTLVRKDKYDIDILVRFNWRYDNISDLLERPLKKVCKKLDLRLERLHGSRDYFRAYIGGGDAYFELIPVTKIKNPKEEKNVTDLSYFHVPYVKRKIKGIENELLLAKTFCHAQKVYGAESYIQGFSGYALECLIIHYKSFVKMLKELVKVKLGERLVIDIEKYYKRKNDIFFELNENKLHSPIILIDPTYKERNALASLGHDTFGKFQKAAREFLKKPSRRFFVEKPIDIDSIKKRAKRNKAEFLHVLIGTNKQPGDIAGTKLKKFHYLLEKEAEKYFKLIHHEFQYDEKQGASVYMIVKSRKEVVRIGPPLHMKKHVRAFKKEHRSTYEKNKFIHSKVKVNFTANSYLDIWKKDRSNKRMMKEMSIVGMKFGT